MIPVVVIVPGRLDTPTGGFVYDRWMVGGLRAAGRCAGVIVLAGAFPTPSPAAVAASTERLAALAHGTWAVVDGLVLTPLSTLFRQLAARLNLIALIHHPLCDEPGLSPRRAAELFQRERDALQPVRGVIVTSETTKHRLADFAVPAARIAVVTPGAVDRPPPLSIRRKKPSPPEVLSVGSLIPRKGQDLLLAALAPLRHQAWRLALVGPERDAAFARRLRLRARALRLSRRVTFHGAVAAPRLARCYARADVFALASRHEGFGIVLLEALAHGLPIVTSNAGAIPEALPAGSATIVESGNRAALTGALRPLLTLPAKRVAAAGRARTFAGRLRPWSTAVSEFQTALNRIIAE